MPVFWRNRKQHVVPIHTPDPRLWVVMTNLSAAHVESCSRPCSIRTRCPYTVNEVKLSTFDQSIQDLLAACELAPVSTSKAQHPQTHVLPSTAPHPAPWWQRISPRPWQTSSRPVDPPPPSPPHTSPHLARSSTGCGWGASARTAPSPSMSPPPSPCPSPIVRPIATCASSHPPVLPEPSGTVLLVQ